MGKKKNKRKANQLGHFRRNRLLKIGRHLDIPEYYSMANRILVEEIARRKGIGLGPVNRLNAEAVLLWFENNEPDVLRQPMNKPGRKRAVASKKDFYKSWDWRTLRMGALKRHGPVCQCCGTRAGQPNLSGEPARICVDHIKPISKYWDLRLDPENLQILCDDCNMGKGAWDQTDWRDEGSILDDEPLSEIEMQLGERLH